MALKERNPFQSAGHIMNEVPNKDLEKEVAVSNASPVTSI